MKTRKEIYGKECAEILRNITLYHNIRKEQIIKLHPNISPEVCEKIIFHLQNNRHIYHDKATDIIYDNSDGSTDFETIYCLWVICDFIDKTEYHSSSDFPVNAVFFAEGELYELSFIRDYDNLELKQILDVIAAFLMEDDSGLLIDAYNTTETGKTDCTEISVMEKRRFSDWIKEHEKHLKNISDF